MNSITLFQAVILGVFLIFIVLGVAVFAGLGNLGQSENIGTPVIWGPFPETTFNELLSSFNIAEEAGATSITYLQKNPATLNTELTEAIASGRAPSLVFLPENLLFKQFDKLIRIPDASLSARTFKDAFVQEGELFLSPSGGAYGLPFSVDPLVLYWNRDLFFAEGLTNAPRTWDEVVASAEKLSKRSPQGALTQSAVSLGGFSNISNAKEVLSSLFLQTGSPIIALTENGLAPALAGEGGSFATPSAALRFYTDFSNPVKVVYSWNRSLPEARKAFTAGVLALYIGFASEFTLIRSGNPNLNFDVALLPQIANSKTSATYGSLTALVIPNTGANQSSFGGILTLASLLSGREFAEASAQAFGIPPARRDLLGSAPEGNPVLSVFYRSALIARGWLDPDPNATSDIMKTMVESVTSGRSTPTEAIGVAQNEFGELLPQSGEGQ